MNKSVNLGEIISNFKVHVKTTSIHEFGNGHINDTYLLSDAEYSSTKYILQKINHHIFKDVDAMIRNIWLITNHLRAKYKALGYEDTEKRVLRLIPSVLGDFYFLDSEGNYWRMYHFLEGTKTYDKVSSEKQAYEGGKAFGQFQALLSDLYARLLTTTIPDFLNMEKRLEALEAAVALDPVGRVATVEQKIRFIRNRAYKMCFFQQEENVEFIPVRVIHNDTKFNNLLLDANDKAQCVIDLDTVMPGYVAYDFGDGARTIINTAAEDEAELEKIDLNISFFKAYTEGYLSEAVEFITQHEVDSLIKGVLILPFMQAVRFLTDYLLGDPYYKIQFEGHNLQRANAQMQLFCKLEDNKELLASIIEDTKDNLGIRMDIENKY